MRNARIVATGTELLRAGVRGFEPVVQEIVQDAQKEIQLVAYVFTPSARSLLEALGNAADLGIRVDVVVNRVDRQATTIKAWLKSAPSRWSNFRVFDFVPPGRRELHAKVCVADRKRGSSGPRISHGVVWFRIMRSGSR